MSRFYCTGRDFSVSISQNGLEFWNGGCVMGWWFGRADYRARGGNKKREVLKC